MGRLSFRPLRLWLAFGALPAWLVAGPRAGAQVAGNDSVPVVVASRTLPRGTVLQPTDILPGRRARPARPATSPAPEPGWITRRVIRAGEVLDAPAVAPRPTIAAGDRVQFVVTRNTMELSLPAVAMFSAMRGDTIAVRLATRRRATGIVAGPARVVAPTPGIGR